MKYLFLAFVATLFFPVLLQSEKIKIKMAYETAEAYPECMGNGESIPVLPGVAVEVIQQAARDIGVEVELQRLPNVRVLVSLKEGEIDGAFFYSFKTERQESGQYPMKDQKPDRDKRLTVMAYYLYKLKGAPLSWDGSTITNVVGSIGANMGYSVVDDLKKLRLDVDEVKYTKQNFDKLLFGRIAGYAAQGSVADQYIAANKIPNVEKLPQPLSTKDYYLMFSHQFMAAHGDIAKKFWQRIAEIRDKKILELLPKYIE